jgi:phosphatidylserine/phosphatidylglycerophosphate/cardiolipin synthase-like enzyme
MSWRAPSLAGLAEEGALPFECKEPEILRRLEVLGPRLRAIIDDHDEQGNPESAESISARRLSDSGAEVRRLHFGRQQHIKVLLVRRSGKPIRILTGSTNFSLRGFYIQAYNALLFNHDNVASLYGAVFDAY